MDKLFKSIINSYNSLWHAKVLGDSLEIVTPMVTTNECFVSVFVTKRSDYYVVTDGGWISAGYYDCDLSLMGSAYNKLFQYYLDNYNILQTVGHGRTMYYKKVREENMVVNCVFELSNFISAVVSGTNIQFMADKKEQRFRQTVREYLIQEFEEGTFKYKQKLIPNSAIEYGAISNFSGHLQLLNIVTGSNIGYYRDSLCRSNFYFEAAQRYADSLRINKTIAILDDTTPSVYNSLPVREMIELSAERTGNTLLPWREIDSLAELLVA